MPQAEVTVWLLLAATAAGVVVWYLRGWWIKRKNLRLRQAFYLGVSELLQDETDRALSIFMQLASRHGEMVELQLMLANLFRQRGEVDRAIRIHQNLLDSGGLSTELKREVMTGLGLDFMKAGVYDRAESQFLALEALGPLPLTVLKSLVQIYEMERDWQKAIRYALQLERQGGKRLAEVVAHYYAELAEQALRQEDRQTAQERITQALARHPESARARMMEARMYQAQGEWGRALNSWKKVLETRPDLLLDLWVELVQCHRASLSGEGLSHWLESVLERAPAAQAQVIHARVMEQEQGLEQAEQVLREHLLRQPTITGVAHWLELIRQLHGDDRNLGLLADIVQQLKAGKRPWHCSQCGFSASSFHWQCPGCRGWGSIHFIQRQPGE